MRLAQESKSVVINLKVKQRDTREKVNDKNGKPVENPRYNKFYYETAETIEVFDTTPTEVKEVVLRGLLEASKRK